MSHELPPVKQGNWFDLVGRLSIVAIFIMVLVVEFAPAWGIWDAPVYTKSKLTPETFPSLSVKQIKQLNEVTMRDNRFLRYENERLRTIITKRTQEANQELRENAILIHNLEVEVSNMMAERVQHRQ